MDRNSISILENEYGLKVMKYQLLRERGRRRVWRIETNRGMYCFKKYDLDIKSYMFSFEGQQYLMNKHFYLPHIIKNNRGELFSLDKYGTVYSLFQWIKNGRSMNSNDMVDVKKCLASLANFHRIGKGFTPSRMEWSKYSYRLNNSKELKLLQLMNDLNDEIRQFPQSIRTEISTIHERLIERTNNSADRVELLIKTGVLDEETKKHYIAHNDIADINFLLTKRETYIIDYDDLTYNFPTDDFEQLFIKGTRRRILPQEIPVWLNSYLNEFPLSDPLRNLLIQKLALPTHYSRFLKSLNGNKSSSQTLEILKKLIQWEQEKYVILKAFRK